MVVDEATAVVGAQCVGRGQQPVHGAGGAQTVSSAAAEAHQRRCVAEDEGDLAELPVEAGCVPGRDEVCCCELALVFGAPEFGAVWPYWFRVSLHDARIDCRRPLA